MPPGMRPDMRRNRYLEKQLERIRTEGRAERVQAAVQKRAIERDIKWFESGKIVEGKSVADELQQRWSSNVAKDAAKDYDELQQRWCQLPGERNDLLEAELMRTRSEWKRIQGEIMCQTIRRCERDFGVELGEHWATESELRDISKDYEARQVVEESKAWIRKHEDLTGYPHELRNWALALDLRERELLPEWTDGLVSSRLERKACIHAFPSEELDRRLDLKSELFQRQTRPIDVPGAVSMRRPCEVERELEKRLGLSTSCRLIDDDIVAAPLEEALLDTQLERELEERLGLSSARQVAPEQSAGATSGAGQDVLQEPVPTRSRKSPGIQDGPSGHPRGARATPAGQPREGGQSNLRGRPATPAGQPREGGRSNLRALGLTAARTRP